MKKIVKLLLVSVFILFNSVAFAKTPLNIIVHYPPGGGLDANLQNIVPSIEEQGYNVTVSYVKSCNQALDIIKNGKENTLVASMSPDFQPGNPDASCVYDAETDGLKIYAALYQSPSYLCNSIDKTYTINDFYKKEIKIGMAAPDVTYFTAFLNSLKDSEDVKVKIVPYRGAGGLKLGIVAGDLDMFLNSSLPILNEVQCLTATSTPNVRELPFIGEHTKNPNEFPTNVLAAILIGKNGNISQSIINDIKTALQSDTVSSWLRSNNMAEVSKDTDVDAMLKHNYYSIQDYIKNNK